MSNELQRWAEQRPALVPSRAEREHARAVGRVLHATRLTGLQVDAEAAIAGRIMERAVDLDAYRRQLANGDPVLDAVLARIEVGFVDKAIRVQRNFGSGFGL
ncbi:hypothetical protein [Pseudactinotalea sp. HY158]|uniref:hypothetical protein n=1 Tax=Pseudactinotalea sp. HY158 TaxID=2654547 RepID=UPI00129C1963|nr:hypothetical protein [Pseudactinotalea sp. HY158]QGH68690.1 hypothetical protein GCE65_03640 [Pseudactinotalea sp. HY158]